MPKYTISTTDQVRILTATILLSLVIFDSSQVNATESENKTLSPYFFVRSETGEGLEEFPLKETSSVVHIAGVIADVKISQVYENRGNIPIEAIYVFPGSTRAAVYGMTMTIGERVVTAKVKEKGAAKKEFDKAKEEGKSASLLEQHRPNVFQMSVANILPGEEIVVELNYTELLVSENGIYEFVYPTVVGPRYSDAPAIDAPPSEQWVANPYLFEGELSPYSFSIDVTMEMGIPIRQLLSPSHQVDVVFGGPNSARVSLKASEADGGNKDYILKYSLEGDNVESGLVLYKGKEENFFLLMVQPPQRIKPEAIPPREYIFVLDVSGSMHGFPLNTAKELLKQLMSNLRSEDTFNVMFFAGGSTLMSDQSLRATPQNIKRAVRLIGKRHGGGATQLLPALKRALLLPHEEIVSRTIVIVTDGYVTVETAAFDLIQNNIGNANVFSFGIGTSVNRFLIEGLARAGSGKPFVVTKPDEASRIATSFKDYIQYPVLTGIGIDFEGFDVYEVEPLQIPDVFAERPVTVFGKWKGSAEGGIQLSGYQGDKTYIRKISISDIAKDSSNKALRYLWARHRIAELGDYNHLKRDQERVNEITKLGLRYNLLTPYTSFIAVDHAVRNDQNEPVAVKQPLPLPKGVGNHAVGNMHIVPEPSTYMMMGVGLLFLLWAYRNNRLAEARKL